MRSLQANVLIASPDPDAVTVGNFIPPTSEFLLIDWIDDVKPSPPSVEISTVSKQVQNITSHSRIESCSSTLTQYRLMVSDNDNLFIA